jgi:hypothetical protein
MPQVFNRNSFVVPFLTQLLVVAGALSWSTWANHKGLNGQDAHDYLRIAKEWSHWSIGEGRPRMVEHPHGYPIAGALLGIFGSELLGLRLISASALLLIAAMMRWLLLRPGAERIRVDVYVLLAVVLSPFMLRYSMVVMSDVPAMAIMMAAFLFTVRWLSEGRSCWPTLALLFIGLALGFRIAVAPLVLPLILAIVHGPSAGRRMRWVAMFVGLALLIVGAWYALGADVLGMLGSPLREWSPFNLFRRELHSDDGVLHYTFPNLLYVTSVVIHPGFFVMGLLLIPFVRRSDLGPVHARLALIMAVCYLLFIAGMPFQNDRVLLMVLPLVALLCYPAFTRALEFLRSKKIEWRCAVAVLAVIQAGLFIRAMVPFIHRSTVEQELAAIVNSEKPELVYTHGMGAAFVTYCPGVKVNELWYMELDHFEKGAMVVVHPRNLEDQWEGRPPAINWTRAQLQGVQVLHQRQDGWIVARVR